MQGCQSRIREKRKERKKSSVVADRKGPIVPLLGIGCRTENILQTDREKLITYKLKCREDNTWLMFDGKGEMNTKWMKSGS